jgi:anaphase-promoting complex subunit 4
MLKVILLCFCGLTKVRGRSDSLECRCGIAFLTSVSVGCFSLLNLSFRPHSAQSSIAVPPSAPSFSPAYVPFDPSNGASLQPSAPSILSPSSESANGGIVTHTFPSSGPKAKPIRIDVNGRKERRVVCVLYADGLRYDVLDLDSRTQEGEVDAAAEGDGENGVQIMSES